MDLVFAFALNNDNQFEACHFGDAHKYAIYTQKGDKIIFREEIENIHRNGSHGDSKKGNAIIKFLVEQDVNALVSKEFGRNITMVNKHFIPIIISKENPEKVVNILQGKLHWIQDEWINSNAEYKLFKIKSSILKLKVEE